MEHPSFNWKASFQKLPSLRRFLPGFAYRNKIVPIELAGDELTVAMADVLDVVLIDELQLITSCPDYPHSCR